jgi:hypothetical protein
VKTTTKSRTISIKAERYKTVVEGNLTYTAPDYYADDLADEYVDKLMNRLARALMDDGYPIRNINIKLRRAA